VLNAPFFIRVMKVLIYRKIARF